MVKYSQSYIKEIQITTTRYRDTFFLLAVPTQTEAAQNVTRIAVFIL